MQGSFWRWGEDMKGKFAVFVIFLIILLSPVSTVVSAEEAESLPVGLSEIEGDIPSEVRDKLPDGLFSENGEEASDALTDFLSAESTLSLVEEFFREGAFSALVLFAKLCGILLLSAVFNALCRSVASETLSGAMRFCSSAVIFATVINMQIGSLRAVELYFERITALMTAMIPVTGAIWAMGGNVSTATSGTATMYVLLSVCEGVCSSSVLPFCSVLTALSLCNALWSDTGLRGFISALRKIYTFVLGMIMTALMASLTTQNALTSAADSVAARTARLISTNVIPVVGGSVGEALRTVAASVGYLRSLVGIGGVAIIAVMLLPTLLSLISYRLAFLLASGVAEMLGCDTEGKLISELGSIYAVMIAVVAMSAVMFIFALTVFSRTAVALG